MILYFKFTRTFLLITATTLFTIGCAPKDEYDPDTYLNAIQKDKFINNIIRYSAKAPEGVDDKSRFEEKYDLYYLDKASRVKLERYFPHNDEIYFLISQPAPSLTEKRHATGGKLKFAPDGSIKRYEEIFRTWKMIPDTLKARADFLFEMMLNNKSLEPFLTKNAGDQYIEFPDDKVFFDVNKRTWSVRNTPDSVRKD
jgi:hypothetical protein